MSLAARADSAMPADLVQLTRMRAARAPAHRLYTYLADGEAQEVVITLGELDRRARIIAMELQRHDCRQRPVLLAYRSGVEFIFAFFGCLYAGAIAVPVPAPRPNRGAARVRAVLQDADPAVVLTESALARRLEECVPSRTRPCVHTDALQDGDAHAWQEPVSGPDALALLQYSSGSTATPRGVMLSHGNLLANLETVRQAFEHDEESTVVGWLPPTHDMGLIGNILQPLYAGARCVLMPPEAFVMRPLRWLQAITRYRGRTSGGPNFAYEHCLRQVRPEQRADLDLSTWSLAFNGAEPVRMETMRRFAEFFAPCGFRPEAFYPCYGLAEATLFVSGGPRGAPRDAGPAGDDHTLRNRVVDCGAAGAGQELRIVEPERDVPCAQGAIGEICVAGASVAQGYWRRPELDAQTFVGLDGPGSQQRFLRTGDLGFLLEGHLHVVGRRKDLIIVAGQNYFAEDIEASVVRHCQAVAPGSCAALAVPGADGERLVVVIELDRRAREAAGLWSGEGDAARLVADMREAIVRDHDVAPAEVLLVQRGRLPRTTSGKLRRHACTQAYLDGALQARQV